MSIVEWAVKWNVPLAAVKELQASMGIGDFTPAGQAGASEANVQSRVRIAASRRGDRLFRNNVGAGKQEDGSFIRWGLANESKEINRAIKSADLIGIRRVVITPEMVGRTIGQFWSCEVKEAGWRYTGTDRERAQKAWADLVVSMGGHASFVTDESQI